MTAATFVRLRAILLINGLPANLISFYPIMADIAAGSASVVDRRTNAGRTEGRRPPELVASGQNGRMNFTNPDPSPGQMLRHLRRANAVAQRALALGRHPFGALLVGPDHETVLAEQGNVDTVNHAESVLARTAALNFPPEHLWGCTLYTTVEPCCMCAATQYWANIGRLVYGLEERRLLEFTGDHAENPTLDLPCREVFARGQRAIRVWGPVAEVEAEIAALHAGFWRAHAAAPT